MVGNFDFDSAAAGDQQGTLTGAQRRLDRSTGPDVGCKWTGFVKAGKATDQASFGSQGLD